MRSPQPLPVTTRRMADGGSGAPSGFLPLLKPPGPTSQQVVRRVARWLDVPAGHAGTLDPDAAGVVVMAVGSAKKL